MLPNCYNILKNNSNKVMNIDVDLPSSETKSSQGSRVMSPRSSADIDPDSCFHQLNAALQENVRLRSRLREEMEEKSALEQKVSALVAQLDDAKRSLQDTSFALHKATLVNSQMKSKKEERDVELLESNQYMQRRIHDLECQLHEMRARALESMSNKYDSNNSAKSDFSDVSVESLRNELTAARAQIAELMHANHHLAEFQPLHMEASQSQFVKDKSMYFYGSSSHSTDDGECKESVSETHVRLKQQKAQARTIIMDWYHKFVRENGREPTKAERDVCVGVDYRLYRRAAQALKDFESRRDMV